MKIAPLSEKYLQDAIKLCNTVFPDDVTTTNPPELGFKASLYKEKYKQYWDKYNNVRIEYFVLLSDFEEVIGITGIFQNSIEPETGWIGWFCVDPQYRGKGYGEMLLNFTIEKAREYNYGFLKIYTDAEESPEAQYLYKKLGFEFEKESNDPADENTKVIILKKTLK